MKEASVRYGLIALAICVMTTVCGAPAPAMAGDADIYRCPPCGHASCAETTYGAPGACGDCGMALITVQEAKLRQQEERTVVEDEVEKKTVAILVFDGVEIIDYTGPWEIFGAAGFDVFSVAKSLETVTTTFGMSIVPSYTLDEHPQADIFLVPGGNVFAAQEDPAVRSWINEAADEAEVILSVCNGAYILAKAGLLTGLRATTTRPLVDGLANAAEGITVVHDVRYVDNGKIITAGGLSAGMDAALHVVSRYLGVESATELAYSLEYDWRQEEIVRTP